MAAFAAIPLAMLSWRRALQFSPDGTLAGAKFQTLETSTYGGPNSLDIRAIERPDASYDFISLSQVLDFVDADRVAFAELARIGSDCVVIHLAFTSNMRASVSQHYPEPHGTHGRWHEYGTDVFEHLGAPELGLHVVATVTTDPVTEVRQPMFLLARARNDALTLRAALGAFLDVGWK